MSKTLCGVELANKMIAWAKTLSKEECRVFLLGAGIIDENGELTKPYRED